MRNGGTPSQEWILSACKFHTFVYHVAMPAVVQYLSAGATSIRIWMVCTPFSHPLTWIVPRGLSTEMVFWVHWLSHSFFISLPCKGSTNYTVFIDIFMWQLSQFPTHICIEWSIENLAGHPQMMTYIFEHLASKQCHDVTWSPTLLSNISFVHGKEYAYLTNKLPIFSPLSVLYIT